MYGTDLQLGGGYTYQWESAILLALNYFFEPVAYNPSLFDLITTFLGEVAQIHLEGKDSESGTDLEDINLTKGEKRIFIQVKTKQAEGERWTLTDPLLLKALYNFYANEHFTRNPEATHFVFLTNRPFNPDLVILKNAIHVSMVEESDEAGKLYRYLSRFAQDNRRDPINPAQFYQMLSKTLLVEYLSVDEVKANVQAKLQAYGRRDWKQAHAVLFEYFARQSTRIGGGKVTRESIADVLGITDEIKADRTPGGIKTNWTVPFRTLGEVFFGRQDELETTHLLLREHDKVGITGMGGIGKTQLAVEYAFHHKDEYPHGIFWINATNSLLQELAGLAEGIGLVEPETQLNLAVFKLRDYLQQNRQALLVFDNLKYPSDINQPIAPGLIPSELGCNILVTTRRGDFPDNLFPHEIKVLSVDASLRLLLRGRPEALDPANPEHGVAEKIAATLGWLPLALELASAFLDEYREEVPLTDYFQRLHGEEGILDVVDDTELEPEHLATRHTAAVGATLKLQWAQLEDENARHLFVCAGQQTQADWIPNERLGMLAGVELTGSPGRPSQLSRGLKKLKAISLVEELTGGRLRLHPLVHDFSRGMGDDRLRSNMATNLSNTLENMEILEIQVHRRGANDVIKDISVGLELIEENLNASSVYTKLDDLKQVLDRESHNLRDWNPNARPAFLLQQLAWRAHAMQKDRLAIAAEDSLEARNLTYLKWRWGSVRERQGLLRILKGEVKDNIYAVAVTSDGKTVVSGSFSGVIHIWDLDTGNLYWKLHDHTSSVNGVALARDGQIGISGSADGTLLVWDFKRKVIVNSERYDTSVTAVAINVNGHQVAVGLETGIIQLRNLDNPENLEPLTLTVNKGTIRSLAFFGNNQLLSGSTDGSLSIWDLYTGETQHLLEYGMGLEGTAISEDGRRIVSVGHEGWKVWDLDNYELVRAFRGNRLPLCITLSKDGSLAVVGTKQLTVEVWDLENWKMIDILEGHDNSIFSLALSPDETHVVSASDDLYVWNISLEKGDKGELEPIQRGHNIVVSAIAIDRNGERVVSGSRDRTLRVWNLSNGNEIRVMETDLYPEYPHQLAIHEDGSCIVIEPEGWQRWDSFGNKTSHELRQFPGYDGDYDAEYRILAISGDGRHAILEIQEGNLYVWNLEDQIEPKLLSSHSGYIDSIMMTFDGSYAVSLSQDESIILWDVVNCVKQWELRVDAYIVMTDGRYVVAATMDHNLIVWDIEEESRQVLVGHNDSIGAVSFTSDGRNVVSGSRDGTILVWDLMSGRDLARFDESHITALRANRNLFVVGNVSGSIYCLELWESMKQ